MLTSCLCPFNTSNINGLTWESAVIRTGLFKYVIHSKVEEYHRQGWMIVADLGQPHGYYSVLMWHCECGQLVIP